ncbi:hypothetical protein BC937DRAFT_91938 [Endogone sp. FLAS-F59071]|nr:hypothetical protein BC937DRAFT_91938 [Endogone sp. FLAS-F59071]|eukprot:RUS15831.1 hypothetical protein BC937DRAFT_91938 [Endogone sp. FLAS-F59071]
MKKFFQNNKLRSLAHSTHTLNCLKKISIRLILLALRGLIRLLTDVLLHSLLFKVSLSFDRAKINPMSKRSRSKATPEDRPKKLLRQASSDESEHLQDKDFLNPSTSKFKKRDIKALNVSFKSARSKGEVIPAFDGRTLPNLPEEYFLEDIDSEMLSKKDFDIDNDIDERLDDEIKTFIDKLHDVVLNGYQTIGTREAYTDTLVDDLLRIVRFNRWPLKINNHPLCRLFVEGEPYVSSDPEFVVSKKRMAMLIVEDKHLRNVNQTTGFGEAQIAGEILACGDENIRLTGEEGFEDQVIFAARVISTHVTFYKAEIPAEYWEELGDGLPKEQSVEILRWPARNGIRTGLDLAEPDGRKEVLRALVQIRESFLE